MIATQNISLSYSGKPLFKNVNIKFTAGNCYGIIGANGTGKSTFLKVLSGELEAYRPAPGGVRIPIAQVEPGGVFGDVLGGSSLSSPVTVLAAAPCEVLLLPYERLLLSDGSPAHQRVVQNLVRTISDKYFSLSRRIALLVLKSLRAKVCAYLLSEAERAGSLTFSIPFSRIQLADYLNCDRSALSRELSQMQRDGLLDTYKSSFKLLEPAVLKQMVQ